MGGRGPGGLIRAASLVLPGLRRTRGQAPSFARAWQAANEEALTARGPLWVALGDSTGQGIGAATIHGGYVGQLLTSLRSADPTWRLVNLSRTGARVADVLSEQLPVLDSLPETPALVTCAAGANDLLWSGGRGLAGRLRSLLERLPPGAVVATLPQGVRPRLAQELNRLIEAEAARHHLVVADVWAFSGPPWKGKFSGDGFHPNERGYADWARAFATALGRRH